MIIFFVFCFSSFFVFLIFSVVFTLSPCVFAVSTSSCTFCKFCFCFVSDFSVIFHLFCWLGSFVLFLLFECSLFFFCSFFFSLCVMFCFRCLWLFQTKIAILLSLCSLIVQKNSILLVKFLFLECPFSNTVFPFLHVFATLQVDSLLLVFSFLVRGEGRVQKTRPEVCCWFSLTLFHYLVLFPFLPILMFSSSPKKKYRNCVSVCVSHQFFVETIHQKCVLTLSLQLKVYFRKKKFPLFSMFVLILCFCILKFKRGFFASIFKTSFCLTVYLLWFFFSFFPFLTSLLFSSPFFFFHFFTLFSVCFSCSFFSFLLAIFLFSFSPILCTFTSPVLCFRLFEPKKHLFRHVSSFFFDSFYDFLFQKESPVPSKKHFCFRH